MDTLPVPLDGLAALAATHGSLNDFRITAPAEIARLLQSVCNDGVPLNFNGPDGSAYSALPWALDSGQGVLSVAADPTDPQLQALLEADEAVVVCWLQSVKLQFEVQGLLLVHQGGRSALRCSFPAELWRFQRRNSFRVRPLARPAPTAELRHPALPDVPLLLRVLDLSIGGCALFLPDDVPAIVPGVQLGGVQLQLDADTRLTVALRLHHVTGAGPESRGLRLGCELLRPGTETERLLQRYIDQTQKRRRVLAVD